MNPYQNTTEFDNWMNIWQLCECVCVLILSKIVIVAYIYIYNNYLQTLDKFRSIFLLHTIIVIDEHTGCRCFQALIQSSDVDIVKKWMLQGLFCAQTSCWFQLQKQLHHIVSFGRDIRYKACEVSGRPLRVQVYIFVDEFTFLECWIV